MSYFIVSSACFVLWAVGINLVCSGLILTCKRKGSSALLITAGIACFAAVLVLGVFAHIDIAHSARYAGITLAFGMPLLLRRKQRTAQNKFPGKYL